MPPKKQGFTPFPPWQTKSQTGRERIFIRLGESQLMDKAMLLLTPGAFQTYCYMLLTSGGRKEFIYPKSQYLRICGTEAFSRQRKELIKMGFIKVSENGNNIVGKTTLYAFSDEWRTNPETPTVNRNAKTKRPP